MISELQAKSVRNRGYDVVLYTCFIVESRGERVTTFPVTAIRCNRGTVQAASPWRNAWSLHQGQRSNGETVRASGGSLHRVDGLSFYKRLSGIQYAMNRARPRTYN